MAPRLTLRKNNSRRAARSPAPSFNNEKTTAADDDQRAVDPQSPFFSKDDVADTTQQDAAQQEGEDVPIIPQPFGTIVCGRAAGGHAYSTNIKLKRLIMCQRALYDDAVKEEKGIICQAILDCVLEQAGSFVYYDTSSNTWEELAYNQCVSKISQTFRDLRGRHGVAFQKKYPTTSPDSRLRDQIKIRLQTFRRGGVKAKRVAPFLKISRKRSKKSATRKAVVLKLKSTPIPKPLVSPYSRAGRRSSPRLLELLRAAAAQIEQTEQAQVKVETPATATAIAAAKCFVVSPSFVAVVKTPRRVTLDVTGGDPLEARVRIPRSGKSLRSSLPTPDSEPKTQSEASPVLPGLPCTKKKKRALQQYATADQRLEGEPTVRKRSPVASCPRRVSMEPPNAYEDRSTGKKFKSSTLSHCRDFRSRIYPAVSASVGSTQVSIQGFSSVATEPLLSPKVVPTQLKEPTNSPIETFQIGRAQQEQLPSTVTPMGTTLDPLYCLSEWAELRANSSAHSSIMPCTSSALAYSPVQQPLESTTGTFWEVSPGGDACGRVLNIFDTPTSTLGRSYLNSPPVAHVNSTLGSRISASAKKSLVEEEDVRSPDWNNGSLSNFGHTDSEILSCIDQIFKA